MVEFLSDYFSQRYGLPSMAEERKSAFIHSVFTHATDDALPKKVCCHPKVNV